MITFEQQIYNKNNEEYGYRHQYKESWKNPLYTRGDLLISKNIRYDYDRLCILGYVRRRNRKGVGMGHGYLVKGSNNIIPKTNSGLWIYFISEEDVKRKKYILSLKTRLKNL